MDLDEGGTIVEEIKVGDKFKGKINGEIFEVTKIDEKENTIYYKCKDEINHVSLLLFKLCLLEKIN